MSKELSVTVNRCPVFGCTIPRGIPHEHPAGVSVVMRDPVAPLNADERAKLEAFRANKFRGLVESGDAAPCRGALDAYVTRGQSAIEAGNQIHELLLQAEVLKRFRKEHPGIHVVPADAPMVPGRKLRDALLMAGHKIIEDDGNYVLTSPTAPRRSFLRDMFQVPHRSFAHLVGHIAFAAV